MSNPCTLDLEAARLRMVACGTTQAALAAECEIDVRTLQRWFAGQRVSLANAERLSAALGVGTSEVFRGAPEETGTPISGRLRLIQRLVSGRDNTFAHGVRVVQEHFDGILQAVSFAAHPSRGFVSRLRVDGYPRDQFVPFRLACTGDDADIEVRRQLSRSFGYVSARLRLRGVQAELAETFQTHSMRATRGPDGSLTLWLWLGHEHREIVLVSSAEFTVTRCPDAPPTALLDLDAEGGSAWLCVRPSVVDLRLAGLPMGFDRVAGARADRVDVPLHW